MTSSTVHSHASGSGGQLRAPAQVGHFDSSQGG
jgi:hypothetical protein